MGKTIATWRNSHGDYWEARAERAQIAAEVQALLTPGARSPILKLVATYGSGLDLVLERMPDPDPDPITIAGVDHGDAKLVADHLTDSLDPRLVAVGLALREALEP